MAQATMNRRRGYPFHPVKTAGALLLAGAAAYGFLNWNNASLTAPTIAAVTGAVATGPRALEGTGAPNGKVQLFVNDAPVGIADVNAEGRWTYNANLPSGSVNVVAKSLEGDVTRLESAPLALNVEAPKFDGLKVMAEGAGVQIYQPQLTNANGFLPSAPFTLAGRGPNGAKLEVLEGEKVLGTVDADANGFWNYGVTPTGFGDIDYTVRPVGSSAGALYTLNIAQAGATGPVCPCKLRINMTNAKARDAKITLTGTNNQDLEDRTGPLGAWANLEAGRYTYTVEKPGFAAFTKVAELPKNRSISVYLNPQR
jgi:hypothetical protein